MAKIHIGAVGSSSIVGKNNINVVFVNTFDNDKYHNLVDDDVDEATTELESKIDKIKHINKDPETYLKSDALYKEYMSILMDKYGGEELFRVALKNGMVTEKIPPRPDLKLTDKYRDHWKIIQNGGELSKVKDLSISAEKERDYLERAGLLDIVEEVTIEECEYDKEFKQLLKDEHALINDDGDYEDTEPTYVGAHSLGHFLAANYSNSMNSDGTFQFEVTIGDIWENSPRLQQLEASRIEEDEVKNVNIGAKWRRCTVNEVAMVSGFEKAGWDIEALQDKFTESVSKAKKDEEKFDKKKKKHKKNKEIKLSKLEIKTVKAKKHEDEIVKEFANFTSTYFDFGKDNILMK